MDGHFDGCDVRLTPPVKTVEELEKILFGVLYSHGMGLFWFDHLKFADVIGCVQLLGHIVEEFKDLVDGDTKSERVLCVWDGNGFGFLAF